GLLKSTRGIANSRMLILRLMTEPSTIPAPPRCTANPIGPLTAARQGLGSAGSVHQRAASAKPQFAVWVCERSRVSYWRALRRVAEYQVRRLVERAVRYGGVRVPVGLAVFKTVARPPARSWVGSTPIRLCPELKRCRLCERAPISR